jgi:hypothetical protein
MIQLPTSSVYFFIPESEAAYLLSTIFGFRLAGIVPSYFIKLAVIRFESGTAIAKEYSDRCG